MLVINESGEQEEFNEDKLRESLAVAGATKSEAESVVDHVKKELLEGMHTEEIYRHAHSILTHGRKPVAARYSMRRALAGLGPSGFPFESFVERIYQALGYTTETNATIDGLCANHEVDVLAQNENTFIVIEAKFHNRLGYKTDLKSTLYVKARADDLVASRVGGRATDSQKIVGRLVTNTKFTSNAIGYGECAGLSLLGWGYPKEESLGDLINRTGLHPLTCLTTLSRAHTDMLMKNGVVLCNTLEREPQHLDSLRLSEIAHAEVRQEIEALCAPTPTVQKGSA